MDHAQMICKDVVQIAECTIAELLDPTNCVQQNSGWTCEFYVVKNIMEFTEALRHKPNTLL